VHVRPAPAVTPYLPLLWSWDFNEEPLCSVVLQKVGDSYHVQRELVLEQGSIAEMCDRFREVFPATRAKSGCMATRVVSEYSAEPVPATGPECGTVRSAYESRSLPRAAAARDPRWRVNRHQQQVIEYLVEENRVLKEQLNGRCLRLTDDQRRRLAGRASDSVAQSGGRWRPS
jgi:hypothetical protein